MFEQKQELSWIRMNKTWERCRLCKDHVFYRVRLAKEYCEIEIKDKEYPSLEGYPYFVWVIHSVAVTILGTERNLMVSCDVLVVTIA